MPSSLPIKKKPASPAKKQSVPVRKPANPVKKPAGPAKKPAVPAKKPAGPVKKQGGSVKKPAGPAKKPAGPVKKQGGSVKKPAGPAKKPGQKKQSYPPAATAKKRTRLASPRLQLSSQDFEAENDQIKEIRSERSERFKKKYGQIKISGAIQHSDSTQYFNEPYYIIKPDDKKFLKQFQDSNSVGKGYLRVKKYLTQQLKDPETWLGYGEMPPFINIPMVLSGTGAYLSDGLGKVIKLYKVGDEVSVSTSMKNLYHKDWNKIEILDIEYCNGTGKCYPVVKYTVE